MIHITLILGILLILASETQSTFKMLVTNGQPGSIRTFSYPLESDPSATWDDCLEYCYNLGTCIVVYDEDGACKMFEVGQIYTATKMDGPVIAFKVLVDNSTNTCPANDIGGGKGYYATPTSYQPYNVTYDEPTWTFTSPPAVSCPTNFTMFVREKGPWCMQVVQHYACCNRTVATIMCSLANYSMSQLSGLDNQAEYQWAVANALPVWYNVSGGLVGGIQYSYTGIWLNGNRTSICTGSTASPCNTISGFQFSDPLLASPPLGYVWMSGQPDGAVLPADGLVLRFNSATVYGVDDMTTGKPVVDTAGCWKGYICGIVPS